ncbi:MAG: hypothetical protein O2945_13535, partial [Planctomycetota bacterium]|nr:hypothetical protein [Planctomycetota bacterium]
TGKLFRRAETLIDEAIRIQQRNSMIGSSRRSEMATFQDSIATLQIRLELCVNIKAGTRQETSIARVESWFSSVS